MDMFDNFENSGNCLLRKPTKIYVLGSISVN